MRCAALLLLALGCTQPADAPHPALEQTNVVLIVVDTLARDHVGSYAGLSPEQTHTPNLDRLAARGLRFTRAYSTAPWTQPSLASLFTGRMPSRHGVQRLGDRLSMQATTLAEYLQQRGHRTHGVVSHSLLNRFHGFAQGFDGYDQRVQRTVSVHEAITSEAVTDGALRALDAMGEDPFFLFAHYFDPHYFYHHHPDFAQTAAYDGPIEPGMSIWEIRDMRDELGPEDLAFLQGLYREEIAYTDHHIGRLLDALRERGLDQRTLVIFTADHGEEFMQHGWVGHTRTLYDELIRVPLIVSMPGSIAPGLCEAPTSSVDILPTVASLYSDPSPDPAWEGISLAEVLFDGAAGPPARRVFAEVSFGPRSGIDQSSVEKTAFKSAVMVEDVKLIQDHLTGSWELFDRAADPGELSATRWPEGESPPALLRELELWLERPRGASAWAPDRKQPSGEELEELRKLGYVR